MTKAVGWYYGLIGLGICLCIAGVVGATWNNSENEVVVEDADPTPAPELETVKAVMIDVQGAVQQPGVYKLEGGTRVVEAIMAAGGLSAQANKIWVARSLNQAEVLRDGMKLYIPMVGEDTALIENTIRGSGTIGSGDNIVHVNSASQAELDSLWGIGEARAKAIIENRPYSSLEELATKAKIPGDVLTNNEGKLGL